MKDYSLKINGNNYDVQIDDVNEASKIAHVIVNGTAYEVEISDGSAAAVSKPQVVSLPKTVESAAPAAPAARPRAAAPAAGGSAAAIKSPLSGTVLSVQVSVGQTVAVGQTLVVLEAMKMENNIDADRAGVVKAVHVQQGSTVMEGDNLIEIE